MPVVFGGVEQRVIKNSIRQLESVYQGERGRHADGSGWSTERDEKRRFTLQVVWRTPAEEAQGRLAIVPRGTPRLIQWDDGTETEGFVDIADIEFIECHFIAGGFSYNNRGIYKKVTLRIEEM